MKLLNILSLKSNELSRVSLSFILTFFIKSIFILSWVLLIAVSVAELGIIFLPITYIFSACLTMFFTYFSSIIFNKYKLADTLKRLIILGIFLSGLLLLAFTYLSLKFVLIFHFIVFSFIYVQLKILSELVIEHKFNYTESKRLFPIIESSEIVSSIIMGLIIYATMPYNSLAIYYFFIFFFTILLYPIICLLNKKEFMNISIMSIMPKKKEYIVFQINPIIKNISIILFGLAIFHLIFEFIFTEYIHNYITSADNLFGETNIEIALTHILGSLYFVYGLFYFIFQFFVSNKILSKYGPIQSIFFHLLVTLLGVSFLLIKFNIFTLIITKILFFSSHFLFISAYHTLYYYMYDNYRRNIREYLDGFIMPIGILFGSILIYFIKFFTNSNISYYVLIITGLLIALIGITIRFKISFKRNLLNKLNAYKSVPAKILEYNLFFVNTKFISENYELFLNYLLAKQYSFKLKSLILDKISLSPILLIKFSQALFSHNIDKNMKLYLFNKLLEHNIFNSNCILNIFNDLKINEKKYIISNIIIINKSSFLIKLYKSLDIKLKYLFLSNKNILINEFSALQDIIRYDINNKLLTNLILGHLFKSNKKIFKKHLNKLINHEDPNLIISGFKFLIMNNIILKKINNNNLNNIYKLNLLIYYYNIGDKAYKNLINELTDKNKIIWANMLKEYKDVLSNYKYKKIQLLLK